MDETLIHSVFRGEADDMYRQEEKRKERAERLGSKGEKAEEETSFTIELDDSAVNVNVRPGLLRFLHKAKERGFKMYIFTAAMSEYADLVLDHIDPNGDFFKGGRFYRQHCTRTSQNYYIKDLRRVLSSSEAEDEIEEEEKESVRLLSRAVLVDNNPICFVPQPENGIFVPSFYDDPNDRALEWLYDVLEALDEEAGSVQGGGADHKDAFDVRKQLRAMAKLQGSPVYKLAPPENSGGGRSRL